MSHGRRPGGRLAVYTLQVLASHTCSALLAELVFTREGFAFPAVYGAVEFAVFALAPLVLASVRGCLPQLLRLRSQEVWCFARCGATMAASHGAGLAACTRINYTTTMIFGSARLPSVLFAGAVLSRGPRPPTAAQVASLGVAVGLCCFGLAERREAPRFSSLGLALVAANLVLGVGTFQLQQQVLQQGVGQLPVNAEQMMMVQYAAGSLLLLLCALLGGELWAFFDWSYSRGEGPLHELLPVVCGGMFTAFGVRALLGVNQDFDAARASAITSLRKVCTFCLSLFLFPKPFSGLHVVGTALVVGGSVGVQRSLGLQDKRRGRAVGAAPAARVVPQKHPEEA